MVDDLDLERELDRRLDAAHRQVRDRTDTGTAAAVEVIAERGRRARRRDRRVRGVVAALLVVATVVAWSRAGRSGDGAVQTAGEGATPGTQAPLIVETPDEGSRVTISPLVDLQDRLTQQSSTELFTVRTTTPSYWRLTALDTFSGDTWRSGGTYTSVDGALTFGPSSPAGTDPVVATFTIEALGTLWLPAPERPTFVDDTTGPIRYQGASSTLIVDTSRDSSDGLTYRVTGATGHWSADQLRQSATGNLPADVARDLELPADLDPVIAETARRQTADAVTTYDKAAALATWFRTEFAYDLQVPRGHGGSSMTQLLQDKRGAAEQLAGTFTVMARTLGLPARVAVGFTPGEADPDDPTLFHVRGEHAHAWPEVFLGEYGWVPFEPTPGHAARP